jgi:hypothetical protein
MVNAISPGDNDLRRQAKEQPMFYNAGPGIELDSQVLWPFNKAKVAVQDQVILIGCKRYAGAILPQ